LQNEQRRKRAVQMNSAAGAAEVSQGQARSAQPLDLNKKDFRLEEPTETGRPSVALSGLRFLG
jgi:hypothetical protein